MKYFLIGFLLSINFCNAQIKDTKQNTDGRLPIGHPIMKELTTFKSKDLKRVDKLYRKSVKECNDFDYCDNLKQFGFRLVLEHGLLENGTKEQKLFYLNEQLNAESNLPNFNQFYSLLNALKKDIPKEDYKKFGDRFYEKNIKIIEATEWSNPNSKNEKLTQLKQNYKLFKRVINL